MVKLLIFLKVQFPYLADGTSVSELFILQASLDSDWEQCLSRNSHCKLAVIFLSEMRSERMIRGKVCSID